LYIQAKVINPFECVPSHGLFYHQSTSTELWLWAKFAEGASRHCGQFYFCTLLDVG
jgi:hypothetical protein